MCANHQVKLGWESRIRQQLPIAPPLPLLLHLKDLSKLEEAEQILQSEDARRVMVI